MSKSAKFRFAEERRAVAAAVDRSGPDAACSLAWGHPDNVGYRLVPGTSRTRVEVAGSGDDSVVAVSRGSPDRPTEVAEVDDVRGRFEAERAANAEAGATFDVMIASSGFSPFGGNLRLRMTNQTGGWRTRQRTRPGRRRRRRTPATLGQNVRSGSGILAVVPVRGWRFHRRAEAAIGWLPDGGTTRDGVPVPEPRRGPAAVKERS